MRRLVTFLLLAAVLVATACSHPDRLPSVPRGDTARALPLGIPNARFFADGDVMPMIQEGMRSLDREMAALRAEGKNPTLQPAMNLSLSADQQDRRAQRLDHR